MQSNQKILTVLSILSLLSLITCMSKNAFSQAMGLCEDAETGRVYDCAGGGGGGGGEMQGGGGGESGIVIPPGTEVPGIQQAGDAVGNAVSDFVEDVKDALEDLFGGGGGGHREPSPAEQEAAAYRERTTGLHTAHGVGGGMLVPNAEQYLQGTHATLSQNNPPLHPAVAGDPSEPFSAGRPIADETIIDTNDILFSIHNFDSWIWGNNLDDTVEFIPTTANENAKLLYSSSSLGTFFLIPVASDRLGEASADGTILMGYDFHAVDRPIKIRVIGLYNPSNGLVHIDEARVFDSHGNMRILNKWVPDSVNVFVRGNPCRNADNTYDIASVGGAVQKLVLTRIQDVAGYGLNITYEVIRGALDKPEKLIQRIQSDGGEVATVEYNYWLRGPYEILESHWYYPDRCYFARTVESGHPPIQRYLSAMDPCTYYYHTYYFSWARAIPGWCFVDINIPPIPECLRDYYPEDRPKLGAFCEAFSVELKYPVFGWERTGIYKYISQPIISKAIDPLGREIIFHYDEQNTDLRTSGPLLTHVERKVRGGGSFVSQRYSYAGDRLYPGDREQHLSEVRDSEGNVIARWQQETINNGWDHFGRQFVGGDNVAPITYAPNHTGTETTVTTREGIQWLFKRDQTSPQIKEVRTGTRENPLVSTFEYDSSGRLLREVLPDGRIVTYEYRRADDVGEGASLEDIFFGSFDVKQIMEVGPTGEMRGWLIEYENLHNKPISIMTEDGQTTTLTYCGTDRARCPCNRQDFLTRITYPDGRTEEFIPDSRGRIAEYKSLDGVISRFYYTGGNEGCSPYGVLR